MTQRYNTQIYLATLFCFAFIPLLAEPLNETVNIKRRPDGQPNMQGVWFFGSQTPFQRPKNLGNKRYYTAAEARQMRQTSRDTTRQQALAIDPNRAAPPAGIKIGQDAETQYETARTQLTKFNGEFRTSLIIDPSNGRLPYKVDAMDIFDHWVADGAGPYDGPEIRPPSERCVNGVGQMAPMINWKYNANMRIIQTPTYIVIAGEMHPPRIIPLDQNYQPHGLRQWMGESTGQWHGDTLVVHTKNFRAASSFIFLKSSAQLQVTEYFTLTSDNEIVYRYTMTDPEIYTHPITVEMNVVRRPAGEQLYEWACHEANYSMQGILRGARVLESEQNQ